MRERGARHIGRARGIHGDARASVVAAPAQVGGVDERRARRVDLRHKGVLGAAAIGPIQHRAGGGAAGGEISRGRAARHIGRARGIHRDADALLAAVPAQVGGVDERGVNDEWSALVIGGDLKAHAMRVLEHVAALDLCPDAVNLLVDDWHSLVNGASGRVQHELALSVDLQALRALEAEHDPFRVRPGGNDEVVLQLALIAVVDEIDTGIDRAVVDLGIGRDVGAPLRRLADQVVCFSRQLVEPAHEGLGRGTDEAHAHHNRRPSRLRAKPLRRAAQVAFCVRVRLCQHEHGLARREIETVAGTAREEADVLVRLSLIRFEVQGQLAVALAHAGLRSRGEGQGKTADKREQREDPARRDTRGLGHREPSAW